VTTPTDELPPFETRLLAELADLVEDRRRAAVTERTVPRLRRTRLAVVTAGVAAAALALAVAPGLTRDSSQPAFAIRELEGGVIELQWFDRDLDGEAVAAELAEFGVEVVVERMYASPSLVGRAEAFVGPGSELPLQNRPGITLPDAEGSLTYRVLIDPDEYDGEVLIRFLVEPPPEEEYAMAEEVFEPGEVLGGLHCALGEPIRTEQLVPYLADLGLAVVWSTVTPHHNGENDTMQHDEVDDVPSGEVMRGVAIDAGTVHIEVRPDGVRFPNPADDRPRLSDLPCTPDQAAAWD
jgi:hypothetical protein